MRLALRVVGVLGLLLAAAVVALAVLLPRLVDRPEVRARIEAGVREATGRELQYESLSAGVLPPEISVVKPSLAADVAGEPPLFTADRVALRLSLLPLLARSIVIDRLSVDDAKIHVVRTPGAGATAAPEMKGAAAPETRGEATPGVAPAPLSLPSLGVRWLDVRGTTFTLDDRTVSPPVKLVLRNIHAKAHADGPFDPVRFEAGLELESGGEVSLEGTVTTAGELDARATLKAVEAKAFAPYLGRPGALAGRLGGTLHATGPATAPSKLEAKLSFDDATLALDAVQLHGDLELAATLSAGADGSATPGALSGPFEIDATQAELAYGTAFRKPPGTAATTAGTLRAKPGGGFDVDELHVKIKNFEAHGGVKSGPPFSVALDAPSFDLVGWQQLFPALGDVTLAGQLALDGIRLATQPVDVDGALVLDGVRVAAAGQPPVIVRGRIEGNGNAIHSRDLALEVAGQPVALEVGVAPLGPAAAGTLVATGRDIDSAALISAFSRSGGSVTGPLRFDARFQAPLASGKRITDVVAGSLDFNVGPGNFKGVSMLKQTIERSGTVVQAAVAAGQAFGGRDVKRMYDDRFESIGGLVKVGGGMARFDPIRAVYRDYQLNLRGSVRLADRALDANGQLVFADASGAGAMRGQTLRISHIGGTVDQPRVELSPEDIAAIAASVSGSAIERRLDPLLDKLRKEAGGAKSPLGAIESFFGGKKRN